VPQRRWLARHAEVFDTVEVNTTFYRLPSVDTVRGWVAQAAGRSGSYSATELDAWARELKRLARRADVFAYFNNDWEGFAVRNALGMRERLGG
jgi:uncharacterized protein YecE (DUF72 family)